MKLALLNTTIATTDGIYSVETISLSLARELFWSGFEHDSAVGHEATAKIMSQLLGADIPVSRQQFEQQVGQQALVLKLKDRVSEGKILTAEEIEEIGYEFKIMTRKA